ncbi:MAG: PDZ domain-containing protein [Gemmatimonadales bacterium]|nr:PDZ domain-containing protein [Gemmatimonadales bacterium]
MRTTVLALLAMTSAAALPAQGRDTATTRARVSAEAQMRADQARMRASERDVELRLREVRPTLEATEIRLRELRPTLEAAEVRLRELRPTLESAQIRLNGDVVRLQENAVRMQRNSARMAELVSVARMRPRLGIAVALEARATDNIGAYVNGVTPGGPADKAGIRAGDIIRKIGKFSLTETDKNTVRPVGESAPGLRLIEVVGKLEAGKAVSVEYRRGTRNLETKITPDDVDGEMIASTTGGTLWRRGEDGEFVTRFEMSGRHLDSIRAPLARRMDSVRGTIRMTPLTRDGEEMPYRVATQAPGAYAFAFTSGGPLGRLELTSLNAGLGSYFGTTEGVLVINVPDTDNQGLMSGDVITAIDGRKVSSPSQLMRILRTYEKDEAPKLQIMRQKRAETVSIKLP